MITSTCLGCGQSDSDPKHVVLVNPAHDSVAWHMDCHARAAMACDVCADQISTAAGATGDALRAHLIGA